MQQADLPHFLMSLRGFVIRAAAIVWFGSFTTVVAFAQSWAVQTVPTRVVDGKPASVAFAMLANLQDQAGLPPVRHVLVYPQPGALINLKQIGGNTDLALAGPWVRAAVQ